MAGKQSVVKRATRVPMTEFAIGEIRRAISTGAWPVGSRIPSEAQLTEDLGIGRTSVREAIRALAHAGLLVVKHGDGTYVQATDEGRVALRRSFRRAAAHDVIEARRGMDVMAARLAATNRMDDDLPDLRESFEARARAIELDDADAFARADSAFHDVVARLSHNAIVVELYTSLHDVIEATTRPDHVPPGYADDAEDSHRLLLTAIEDGDPDAAADAVQRILDRQELLLDDATVFDADTDEA